MRKTNKNSKNSKNKQKSRTTLTGSSFDSSLLSTYVTRFAFRGAPFYVTSAASGAGGLSTQNSLSSTTSVSRVSMDPFQFGGRFAQAAALFLEYRIMGLRFRYRPLTTVDGMLSTTGGSTASPNYAFRSFSWGVLDDPQLNPASYSGSLEVGGKVAQTSNPSVIKVAGGSLSRWRFTSTTTSTPSTIDLRMVSPIQLFFYFQDSSAGIQTYGDIIYEAIVEFRGICNANPIGLTRGQPLLSSSLPPSPEKQDSEESKSTKTKGWF
jgi:hypothetical protein